MKVLSNCILFANSTKCIICRVLFSLKKIIYIYWFLVYFVILSYLNIKIFKNLFVSKMFKKINQSIVIINLYFAHVH